jgi:lambda family phage minor tail protein L
MTDATFAANQQSLTPGDYIELYELDTTPQTLINGVAGAGVQYRWTPGLIGNTPISFGGVIYEPFPVQMTKLTTTGQGKPPTPVLNVSAVGGLIIGLVIANSDLVGCQISRIRTFSKYLDGQPQADPTAFAGPDIFDIDQKTQHDKNLIQFTLSVPFDQLGKKFPARQVLRDACTRSYRFYNSATSAFVQGTCPYVGTSYFDASDNPQTNPALDSCSKRLTGCSLRFSPNPLPTYAFPGAALTAVG